MPDVELTLLADSNGIESDNVSFCKFWDELDYISLHLSGGVEHYAGTGTLTVPQIKDALNSMYSCVDLAGQSASSGKKVILVTAYSSSEYCFNGTWFEEFEPQPSINQDLTAQQNFYEAFFQSLSTHTWIAGAFPWGYWWKGTDYNNTPGDAAFEKGPSHRGKPAETAIYSYYSKLTETLSVSTASFASIKLIDGFNSIEVEIDTGTFSETVNIVVSTQSIIGFNIDYSSGTVNIVPLGLAITKTGSGQPSLPVSITISYSDSDLNDIASESALKLARYNAFGKWVILNSTAYPALNKVVGLTDHFSVFALVELVPAVPAGPSLNNVYGYSNPYRPSGSSDNYCISKLQPGDIVRIYNLTGEFVRDITDSVIVDSAEWDGKDSRGDFCASGVYFALVKRGGDKKILKIALIR